MGYKDFDTKEEAQASSPIQLHKTDYNNYKDLSHFIEQYNIAQQIIKECGKFYKSFLLSKLKTWTQIINLSYRNMLDFTEESYNKHSSQKYITNRIVDIYCHYIYNKDSVYWRDRSMKFITNKTTDELQSEVDECKNKIEILEIELATAIKDNVPMGACEVFSYNLETRITKDNTYKWINVIRALYDYLDNKNYYYTRKLEESNVHLDKNVIEWCKNEYDTTYKKLKKLEDKKEQLENSIINLSNNKKDKLQKEIEEKIEGYNLKDVISFSDGFAYFYKNVVKPVEVKTDFGLSYDIKIENLITDEDFANLMHDIEDYIIGKVREYGLERIFERDASYFIIHNNKLEYFGTNIGNVKISLSNNQTELVCVNKEVEAHKAYAWPSDAPTIRTTTLYTITFNTSNNEVKSYNISKDTEEIKDKRYM